MISYKCGHSLIELLLCIAIFGLILSLGATTYTSFMAQQMAILTIRQLEQAINYARSLAIVQHRKVIICPSYNRFSCGGSWQQGILVISSNADYRFFDTHTYFKALLSLNQSGYSHNSVEVHPNGMTNTNGHFNYKLLNSRYISQFNLYFNKALRVYIARSVY